MNADSTPDAEDGWQSVPQKATVVMLTAGIRRAGGAVISPDVLSVWAEVWAAMLQASKGCMCPACIGGTLHLSSCALHSRGTPELYGPCDCGAAAGTRNERRQ